MRGPGGGGAREDTGVRRGCSGVLGVPVWLRVWGALGGSRGGVSSCSPPPGRTLGAPPQPRPGPVLLQHPARGCAAPGPAHVRWGGGCPGWGGTLGDPSSHLCVPPRPPQGPLGEAHRVSPLLLPAAARGGGLPAPQGWVWGCHSLGGTGRGGSWGQTPSWERELVRDTWVPLGN